MKIALRTVFLVFYCVIIEGKIKRANMQDFVEKEVTFYLYNGYNTSLEEQLFIGDTEGLDSSRFDPKFNTVFIIHGWTHRKDVPWVVEMRESTALNYDTNVIVVDWGPLSHMIYTEARVYTPQIGKQVGALCVFLAEYKSVPMSSIHIVGHSMGAQIAAVAGNVVQTETGQSLGRVTGLDPASPLYEWPYRVEHSQILDPSDALFVDVIHTNARHLGMMTPAGHVDYYPNGGQQQPGCGFWFCSHMRSCEYWIASIKKPDLFKAYSYKSWDEYLAGRARNRHSPVPMGMSASPRIPGGLYFLETNEDEKDYVVSKTTIADSL